MKLPMVTFLVAPLSGLKYIHPAGRPPRPASTAEALSPRRPHPAPTQSLHVATPGTPRGWRHTVRVAPGLAATQQASGLLLAGGVRAGPPLRLRPSAPTSGRPWLRRRRLPAASSGSPGRPRRAGLAGLRGAAALTVWRQLRSGRADPLPTSRAQASRFSATRQHRLFFLFQILVGAVLLGVRGRLVAV